MYETLEGEHIVLRKAKETDWQSMLENVWGNEAVYRWMLFQPTLTDAEARDRCARSINYQTENFAWFVALKDTDEAVGLCAIREEEPGCFEEEFLRGLVIATAPMDTERRLEYTGGFLDRIDNWSTCDSFCSSWKYPKKDSERVHSYFRSLIDSGQEYRMRVSVVFRMSHFIDDQHVDGLLADIESYRNEGNYYKMGAAWAASFCYIAYPEKTMAVLKARKMDDWVYRKTIQKICESYRVSDEDKAVLRSMR